MSTFETTTVPFHLTDEQVAALDDAAHVAAQAVGLDVELTLDPCVGFALSGGITDKPWLPAFIRQVNASPVLAGNARAALLEGTATIAYQPLADEEGPFPYLMTWPHITGGSPAGDR